MRNWSNSPTDSTLEESIAALTDHGVHRIGLEVEAASSHRRGERRTLALQFNMLGFAPAPGDMIECSGLGLESAWTVRRVAEGPRIDTAAGRRYYTVRDENGESRIYL